MLLRSERGIGRTEAAEWQVDAPLFVLFALFAGLILFLIQFKFENINYTLAAGVSMLIFGLTVLRVELGIYVLVVAMLLSPEVNAGAVGVAAQRTLSIRYDDLLIVVIFFGVLLKMAFQGRQYFWLPNPINAGIVLYFGICILSTILAVRANLPAWDRRTASFVMLKMVEFYMIFWMVTNALESHRQINRQLVVFFAVSLAVSIYCMTTIHGGQRVSAPFESGGTEPNTLGGYLTLVMMVAMGLFVRLGARRERWLLGIVIVCAFIPFLFTLSRASYLALVFGVLALGIMTRRFGLIALVLAALIFSNRLMPENVRERVNYTFQEGGGVPVHLFGRDLGFDVDKSTYERIYVWYKVEYNMRVWPWFGGGVEWDRVLDSQYARVIIETGVFGLAAFLFLQYRIFRTTRETYLWSRNPVIQGLGLGCCAALIALIFHSMGTISFLIVRIMEPFWFLIALCAVGRAIALQDHRVRYFAEQRRLAEEQSSGARLEPSPQTSN